MPELRAIAKAKDHFGIGRETTEDVHRLHDELGLYLVCDGAREQDGRWAAETICEVVHRELSKDARLIAEHRASPTKESRARIEKKLQAAIDAACAEIHRACLVERKRSPSSSALGAVLFLGDTILSAHVGNTRLYLVRGGKALRLTRDHTYYEEMLRQVPAGTPVNPIFKKRLTRAIGDAESVPVTMTSVSVMPGDTLVLCSNGVSDYVGPDASDIRNLATSGDPATLHTRIVDWALAQKSEDNITAVVIRLAADPATASAPVPVQRDAEKQLELLRRLRVLAGIRDDERALIRLQSILTFRKLGPGEVVVQQGSPSDEMFILTSGKTEVRSGGKVVASRGPGDVIGEMGFFDRRLRSATVVATEPTELMSIQRWEYDALVEKDWRLGYRILEGVVDAMARKIEESLARQ